MTAPQHRHRRQSTKLAHETALACSLGGVVAAVGAVIGMASGAFDSAPAVDTASSSSTASHASSRTALPDTEEEALRQGQLHAARYYFVEHYPTVEAQNQCLMDAYEMMAGADPDAVEWFQMGCNSSGLPFRM